MIPRRIDQYLSLIIYKSSIDPLLYLSKAGSEFNYVNFEYNTLHRLFNAPSSLRKSRTLKKVLINPDLEVSQT